MSTPTVVLVGPPGAGKSTIGRRLASALSTRYTDTDTLIEEETGQACGDVFRELGEPKFRELEQRIVEEALTYPGVVSLGGGAVTTQAVRDDLVNHRVVWVDVSAEEGVRRTQRAGHRPVLSGSDPLARYTELLHQRQPYYREVSAFRVRTDQRSPQKVVADVLAFLEDDGVDE